VHYIAIYIVSHQQEAEMKKVLIGLGLGLVLAIGCPKTESSTVPDTTEAEPSLDAGTVVIEKVDVEVDADAEKPAASVPEKAEAKEEKTEKPAAAPEKDAKPADPVEEKKPEKEDKPAKPEKADKK
jgi:hypothetical protein